MSKHGWTYKKIGEVAYFINGDRGRNYPSQNDFVESGIPFINAGHLNDGKIDFESMNYINEAKFNSLNSGKIKEGDILFCLRGSLGKRAIVNGLERGAIASSLVILRCETVLNQYLYYFLGSPIISRHIQKSNNGSSQPNLSAKSVSNFNIPVPPAAEQERIVAELDLLQGIIEKKKEQLKAYDQLAQSIFYTMFGDPIDNPKGWEIKKLGEIGTMKTGYTPSSTDLNERGEYPYFKVGDMNTVGNEKYLRFSNSYLDSSFKSFPKGAIVFPKNGAAVATNKKRILSQDSVVDLNTAIFISNGSVNLEFIYRWICQIDFREITRRGAVPTLDTKELLQMNVFLPPLSLQQEFAEKVEAIERQKALVQQSIDETQTMFDYTMDKYFG